MGETAALYGNKAIVFRVITCVLVTLNLVGNVLVVVTIMHSRQLLRTPMHFLLGNLCFSYVIVAIFFFPSYVINDIIKYPDDQTAADFCCKFLMSSNLSWVGLQSSVFTLVTIAFERYFVIVHPRIAIGRFTKSGLVKALIACWVYASVMNTQYFVHSVYDRETNRCGANWSAGIRKLSSLIWLFSCGIVPIGMMGFLYGRVFRNIHVRWKRETAVSRRALLRSRKRMTKTVIQLAVTYSILWLPNIVVWAVGPGSKYYVELLASSEMCLLASGCTIPFLYTIKDEQFRLCLSHMFTCYHRNRVEAVSNITEFNTVEGKSVVKKVRFATPFVLVPRLEEMDTNRGT